MATKRNDSIFSDQEIKHIDIIKGDIQQLETYSFQIKGWMSTFVGASLLSATQNKLFALLALIPIITFWLLDAHYIQLARKHRGVFSDVAKISGKPNNIRPFSTPIHQYSDERFSYINALTSVNVLPFYFPTVLIMLLIYLYI